jgi:hypothetical protein
MAASDGPTTRTSSTESSTARNQNSTTILDPDLMDSGPNPFGDEVPNEEGGVVALAGWSMVAAAVGAAAVVMMLLMMVRRRRRTRLAASEMRTASEIAQHAMSDLMQRSRQESRRMRRRMAKRMAEQLEAAA